MQINLVSSDVWGWPRRGKDALHTECLFEKKRAIIGTKQAGADCGRCVWVTKNIRDGLPDVSDLKSEDALRIPT